MLYSFKDFVSDKAAEQGWTEATALGVVCDFLDELHTKLSNIHIEMTPTKLEEMFLGYVNARIFQETKEYQEYVEDMFKPDGPSDPDFPDK